MTDKPTAPPTGRAAKPAAEPDKEAPAPEAPASTEDAVAAAMEAQGADAEADPVASELLEKAARAICEVRGLDPEQYHMGTMNWVAHVEEAAVALKLFSIFIDHSLEEADG